MSLFKQDLLFMTQSQRHGCPTPGGVQGKIRWGSRQPNLAGGNPARGRGFRAQWYLMSFQPKAIILWSSDLLCIVPHMLYDFTQSDLLHNLPPNQGQANRPIASQILLLTGCCISKSPVSFRSPTWSGRLINNGKQLDKHLHELPQYPQVDLIQNEPDESKTCSCQGWQTAGRLIQIQF